ncbi:MAG: TonB-dependent receptor [Tannerella sp.]|jgi:iron complex outermembrane receptor protein|nr:TonB-dependent receptor [Tannerella sp.]
MNKIKIHRKYLMFMFVFLCIQLSAQNKRDTVVLLNEVIVNAYSKRNVQMRSSQNVVQISESLLKRNFSGSLMHSLEKIPGVKAMSIGSGQSKPAIRGLGFNRLLVAENGIKHEGQQWGDDHGLEIDQFALDNIEIVKGPGALLYGSDAIAGVINLKSSYIPQKTLEGEVNLFGRTNNESIGASVHLGSKKNRFWYKANFTLIDYADYHVPADSIQYYSYYIKMKDRRLRNTAGKEQNGGIHVGFISDRLLTTFYLSDVYVKSGFFADAHGLEVRLSEIDYDKSVRDINLPYHSVNHFKITNHTNYRFDNLALYGDFAYQNNYRKEYSEPVSHGYMPIPSDALERRFDKDTYTANVAIKFALASEHNLYAGFNFERQDNRRGGWGFIIPDFRTNSLGAFVYDRWYLSDKLVISGGVRLDRIQTETDSYKDWYKTPDENGSVVYKERSAALQRTFQCLTWSVGVNYNPEDWIFKANIGKGFRAPIPKELASDGVNYHIFRYEKGNAGLSPEESYQLDAGINWSNEKIDIRIEPYLNYFPNFIYLNPTADYNEGLQMYYYTQSKVFRWGFEFDVNYKVAKCVEMSLTGDYLYARQLSGDKKGYTLPFSPPAGAALEIKYLPQVRLAGTDGYISLVFRAVAAQNEIVPPENVTPGYRLLNAAWGRSFTFGEASMKVGFQANNLLNKRYYDHTGFYRLIDVPEAGRNFSVMIGVNF